jgi:hypothetical protein
VNDATERVHVPYGRVWHLRVKGDVLTLCGVLPDRMMPFLGTVRMRANPSTCKACTTALSSSAPEEGASDA